MSKYKSLKEVFESNPKLLEEHEVKEFISEFKKVYDALKNEYWDYYDRVSDIAITSVCGEISAQDAIEQILDIEFKTLP